jgi:UDP-N-acetylmuramoyl-tripeptide--D-alanyl-D-alanine ligase
LDFTKKAVLLLSFAWLILILIYVLLIVLCLVSFLTTNLILIVLAMILLVTSPLILAYGISIPLWLGQKIIQEPRQNKLIKSARQIFAKHSALKIAIAGSYGKTTAKEILQTVLSEGKKVAFTPGNINTMVGISRFARGLKGDEEVIIFELGEDHVGDVRKLCELVQPNIGIITGINEAHLSSFGTLERTITTIFELQGYLGDKPIYKNQESPLINSKIKPNDKLAFNRHGVDGWKITDLKTDIQGTTFKAKNGLKTILIQTGLLGLHNVGIMAVAIHIADSLGFSTKQIADGFKRTMPFEHRMQPRNLQGAWVIDDTYNGNSEGVQAGLLLLKQLNAKRRIYVTPGLVEQGHKTREVHENIGRQIADVADIVILMKNSVTNYIRNGLNDSNFKGKIMIIDDPLEFYNNLEHFVAIGDVVLMQNDWTDNYA